MKKLLVLGSLLLALCGCGANADSLIKQDIKAMNELADALEAKAPEAKVNELKTSLEEINKKLKALNLSEDDQKKLLERHKDELVKAQMRILKAQNKAIADAFLGQGFLGFPGMTELGKLLPGLPGADEKASFRYDSIAVLPVTWSDIDGAIIYGKDFLENDFPAGVSRTIAKIAPADSLKVIAPAVVREKQLPAVDLKMLGQRLGAKTLLIGKVNPNNRKQIEFQLIVAEDGVLLWGDTIEHPTADALAGHVVQHLTGKK